MLPLLSWMLGYLSYLLTRLQPFCLTSNRNLSKPEYFHLFLPVQCGRVEGKVTCHCVVCGSKQDISLVAWLFEILTAYQAWLTLYIWGIWLWIVFQHNCPPVSGQPTLMCSIQASICRYRVTYLTVKWEPSSTIDGWYNQGYLPCTSQIPALLPCWCCLVVGNLMSDQKEDMATCW